MASTLQVLLQRLADHFMAGEFAEATLFYSYPLVVYAAGEVSIERNAADTKEALADRRAGALAAGASRLEVTIEDVTKGNDGRSLVLANRRYISESGATVREVRVRYFCRPISIDPYWTIEMLELIEVGFPRYRVDRDSKKRSN